MDMLEVDRELMNRFSFSFMKKNKFIPVSVNKQGVLLLAIGRPLNFNARSMIAISFSGELDFVLVPPTQIDVYIDSIVAVLSTSKALDDLQQAKDNEVFAEAMSNSQLNLVMREDDVINNPSVRLVDSVIKEAIPFRSSDIHI